MSKKKLPQTIPPKDLSAEKLVMKDNSLIMASYTLSVEEQRLILASIEKAQRKGKCLSDSAISVSLNVNEYASLYKLALKTAYEGLQKASKKLYERSIRITKKDSEHEYRWLQGKAVYDSGRVDLMFSQEISNHIRDIVNNTAYRLEQATQLRSQHAIRLFEILHHVINPKTQEGQWVVTVAEIKRLFEIEDLYPRWVDFKRRIIVDPIAQINKNTSLRVDWEVSGKVGKRITELRFTVFESSQLALSF